MTPWTAAGAARLAASAVVLAIAAGPAALQAAQPRAASRAAAALAVTKVQQRETAAAAEDRTPRNGRLVFSAASLLRWDGSALTSPEPCYGEQRQTLLVAPRVDLVRCETESFLQGLQADGHTEVWQRPLKLVSERYTFAQRVLGASADGIVLSDLTVVAPRSGATLVAPRMHPVGSESKHVPDFDLTGTALYVPQRRSFLWFRTEVTLASREGGLYEIDAAGRRTLVLPVTAALASGHWRVEGMALLPGGRYTVLAQQFARRGPGGVAVAVFDMQRRKIVFQERFAQTHFCTDPEVVTGPARQFGFTYLDATTSKRVLAHYRLVP